VHNFSQYVYIFSLHVSGDCVPIIRKNNSIYATLVICHPETCGQFKITKAYVIKQWVG